MECVELAPAVGCVARFESGSKLHALHTLRAVWFRLCRPGDRRALPSVLIEALPSWRGTEPRRRRSWGQAARMLHTLGQLGGGERDHTAKGVREKPRDWDKVCGAHFVDRIMRIEEVKRSRNVAGRRDARSEEGRAVARRLGSETVSVSTDHPVELLPRSFFLQDACELPAAVEEQRAYFGTAR